MFAGFASFVYRNRRRVLLVAQGTADAKLFFAVCVRYSR